MPAERQWIWNPLVQDYTPSAHEYEWVHPHLLMDAQTTTLVPEESISDYEAALRRVGKL